MKTALFLISLMLFIPVSRGQEISKAELKEYFLDAEFFFAQEAYADALYEYLEMYNNGYQGNANINYRIGICYLNIAGQKERAIPYLQEAARNISNRYRESSFNQESAPPDVYLYLGNAFRVNDRLSEAIAAYNNFKEIARSTDELQYADQQIASCNNALSYMGQPANIRFTNLGDSVNSNSSNFKAVISGDGRTLVYMNELPFYDAVYFSTYRSGSWSAPINITPQIQSDGDQYVTSISYNGTVLYLTKEDAFNSDIYVSTYEDERWSKSEPVDGPDVNTKYWESHASISRDGNRLYFTSNRRDGVGNMDIYLSERMGNGEWGQAVNLGDVLNTALNEDTPFITENDSILYFSSQGHDNIGGYDIFRAVLGADGTWNQPENMGYPINTTDDDLFYYPWQNDLIGYKSIYRNDGYGQEDIYAIQPSGEKPLFELLAELLPDHEISAEPFPAEAAAAEVVEDEAEEAASVVVEPAPEPVVAAEVRKVELNPLLFGFDMSDLTEEDKAELDKIYDLMTEFPEMTIMFIGHTDIKGPAEYNLRLSMHRAESSRDYLSGRGISQSRLSAIGLGETHFIAINSNPDGSDNPEGRKLNRRVEFEISGLDNRVIEIIIPEIPDHLRYR